MFEEYSVPAFTEPETCQGCPCQHSLEHPADENVCQLQAAIHSGHTAQLSRNLQNVKSIPSYRHQHVVRLTWNLYAAQRNTQVVKTRKRSRKQAITTQEPLLTLSISPKTCREHSHNTRFTALDNLQRISAPHRILRKGQCAENNSPSQDLLRRKNVQRKSKNACDFCPKYADILETFTSTHSTNLNQMRLRLTDWVVYVNTPKISIK